MSRRESRNSLGAGQNDALLEFENFKKKFLLANKHITKLNSTLSVRIEELNSQISVLHVENLRLRAAEIALYAQVKREREKSRTILAETELATLNLTKHLAYLRQAFNIGPAAPEPVAPPSPRAKRPPSSLHTSPDSPQMSRIARAPNVPGIDEEEESYHSSDDEAPKPPSPTLRKSKDRPRLSGSRLPLPSRMSTPPPSNPPPNAFEEPEMETATVTKRGKSSRRQSGLISIQNEVLSVPRSPSPAFGSPIRRAAGLAEAAEESAAVRGEVKVDTDMDVDMAELVLATKKERRKSRGKDREAQEDRDSGSDVILQPREKKRHRERSEEDSDKDGGGKARMKDTANPRPALSPIGNTVHEIDAESSALANARHAIEKSPSPPSRMSTSPPPAEPDPLATGGRERRARKSVNYAEPKLNTKMRKPDPQPAITAPTRKRSSSAASLPTQRLPTEEPRPERDTEHRSSLEGPRHTNGINVDPYMLPLPPSRPASAAAAYASPMPRPTSSMSTSSSSVVKKKRSRPQLPLNEDEESDDSAGTQADAEFVGKLGASTWVEGRRRTNSTSSRKGSDDGRRHSTVT